MKERLKIIADMVTPGTRIADIGTDHGFLPIELVKCGKCPGAIAMDIADGPLERAREHVMKEGLSDRIECRLSDGFDMLNRGDADAAVIAGMGGDLITEIISRKPDAVDELIVSPHTHSEKVRIQLRRTGFRIIEERMAEDGNKFYVFIKAVRDGAADGQTDDIYDLFGKYLIDSADPVLMNFLRREYGKFCNIEQKHDYIKNVSKAIHAMESRNA